MLTVDFSDFPLLSSERLFFRALAQTDIHEVFALRSDKEIMKYIPRPLAKNLDDAKEHIEVIQKTIQDNQGINWAITCKDKPGLIGIIGLYRINPEDYRCELGYILLKEHHNKGYITEAIKPVLEFAFDVVGFHSVEAIIDPDNSPSEKVLQKNGF
ncbi:MAG: GNAT family N-acetyltransferase, partial [Saprospiraceae bacterium]|nr:GNAT family N-acetyltransferase [Saprospiraceae bacterium]